MGTVTEDDCSSGGGSENEEGDWYFKVRHWNQQLPFWNTNECSVSICKATRCKLAATLPSVCPQAAGATRSLAPPVCG